MGKKADPKAAAEPPPPDDPVEDEELVEDLSGDICEGDFVFQDASTYTGEYIKRGEEVVMHGAGRLVSGPESFSGTFEKGAYKSGEFRSCNGEVYKGAFRDNLFHGVGEYTWLDGRVYRGMWRAGRMHGPGSFHNFVVGTETFTGFSVDGDFNSAASKEAKATYLAEYGSACAASASAALRDLHEKTGGARAPRKFLVPSAVAEEGETPRLAADRELVIAALAGPFPEASAARREALAGLVAGLAEGTERPLSVTVYEESGAPGQRLDGQRLLLPQLQYVGQAVEFSLHPDAAATAEPGTLVALVLVNVSPEYTLEGARWKIAHAEAVPPPATD